MGGDGVDGGIYGTWGGVGWTTSGGGVEEKYPTTDCHHRLELITGLD
jgi:hypothetical protein